MFSILKYLSAKIIFTQMIAISVPKAADHYIAIIVVFQKNARDMREHWDEKYMYQIWQMHGTTSNITTIFNVFVFVWVHNFILFWSGHVSSSPLSES